MWLIIGALCFAIGIVALFRGLEAANTHVAAQLWSRLQAYKEVDFEDEEEVDEVLKESFLERVIRPLNNRLGHFLQQQTGEAKSAALQEQLEMAGRPANLTPSGFLILRYLAGIGGVGLIGGAGLLLGPVYAIGGAVLGGLFGYFYPVLWIRQQLATRRGLIARGLPDAMDLITTVVEAGLGFDGAIAEVATRFKTVLGTEFANVGRDVKLGRSRAEALEDMARRCGDEDIHNFVTAIIQSEQMGTTVAKVLRIQSNELRRVRRQRAQQKAASAPVKMLIPMIGCIFPVIWIVLLGPAGMILMKSFGR